MHFRAAILLALRERAFSRALSLQQRDSETLLTESSSPCSCFAYSVLFHIFLNDHYPDFTLVAFWIGSFSSKSAHLKRIKTFLQPPGICNYMWQWTLSTEETKGKRHTYSLWHFLLLAWTSSISLLWHSDSAVASAMWPQSLSEGPGSHLLAVWSSAFCPQKLWSYKVPPEEHPWCVSCLGSHLSSL